VPGRVRRRSRPGPWDRGAHAPVLGDVVEPDAADGDRCQPELRHHLRPGTTLIGDHHDRADTVGDEERARERNGVRERVKA